MSSTCSNEMTITMMDGLKHLDPRILSGPPPPPPPTSTSISSNRSITLSSYLPFKSTKSNESFLNDEELIEDACKRFMSVFTNIKIDNSCPNLSLLSLYNHCDPVIQSGPTCGLVALIMCLKLVNKQIEIDLPTMLTKAQSYGYTRFGEMFSAENMCKFIKTEFSLKAELKHDLDRSMLDVVKHICQGLPVLVPYDADSNYEPCLKEGTRAHWAVICGLCITHPPTRQQPHNQPHQQLQPQSIQFQKIININDETTLFQVSTDQNSWQKTLDYIKRHLSYDRLFVYARQGKSRLLQIWHYKQLSKSNQNLFKVSNKILNDPERVDMIYPRDGKLDHCLANQFILIYR